ncbi:MAG: disulfide bond formation protein B [Holosporales bacterium]|nr:disulfide bond formation protein B [Holosporales bacterium]
MPKLRVVYAVTLCVAFALLSTSFLSGFITGVRPCQLCLITRYLYLSTFALSALSLRRWVPGSFVLASVFLTFAFGIYHLGVESHWWTGPQSCVAKLPTIDMTVEILGDKIKDTKSYCDQINWKIFGLSSTLWSCAISALLFWITSLAYTLDIYIRKLGAASQR